MKAVVVRAINMQASIGGKEMAQILVRDLNPGTIERLKVRAQENRRSLQGEGKRILEDAAARSAIDARDLMERVRARLAGKAMADSADLLREDRGR